MINITINGRQVQVSEDRTLLDACREHGFEIPTLCHHPALEPYGACRLCMVEIQKGDSPPRLVAACTHPCEPEISIRTHSEDVIRSRRSTMELLLAGGNQSQKIVSLATELGVEAPRYRLQVADSCILCGLCVRACNEIVGVSAISLTHRGMNKAVNSPFEICANTCIGCGSCVMICPTGTITMKDVNSYIGAHKFKDAFDSWYCQVCADSQWGQPFLAKSIIEKSGEPEEPSQSHVADGAILASDHS